MTENDALVKVHIDLSGQPETSGESMWAAALGNDLYEIRNVPFFAYSLNFLDVVRAVPQSPEQKPSVLRVERRSGHRTIWLSFADSTSAEVRLRLGAKLNEWRAYFEHAKGPHFAIDVEPEGDYDATLRMIEEWRRAGIVAQYRVGPADSDVRQA